MRGIITGTGYYPASGGVLCDLTLLSSPGNFPLGNYRVIVQADTTGTYLAVYDHTNKKLLIYSDIGTEVTADTDISALVFPFLAVGE